MKIVLKALKWLGICVGVIILLIIIAGVVTMFVVNEKMIAEQMESALNRHVTIGGINAGILSALSGIEVKDVHISNFKTPEQLKALEGKKVSKRDLFVGLKAFKFKIKFLPLLSGNFILTELVLYEPIINVIKYRNGKFNFADLTKPKPKTAEEKAEEAKEKKEAKEKAKLAKKKKKEPTKPFAADDLPLEINIGKIGIEKGELTFVDKGLGQTFKVYNLTTLIHSIEIDPENLNNKNSVGLQVQMGLKTIGKVKSGSVKSFDIGFDIDGKIVPFDKKTKKVDPDVNMKIGLPYGNISGLQIFEKMIAVDGLSKFCGKLKFLKKDIKWKNAYVKVVYKGGIVRFTDSKIKTDDYILSFLGNTNVKTKGLDLNTDLILADKHQKKIRDGITDKVSKLAKGKLKKFAKYIKPEKITDVAMKRVVGKDGKIYLRYKVGGALNNPKPKLVHPELPDMMDLVKGSLGNLKDMAMDKAKEAAQKAAGKAIDKGKKKAQEALEKKLKGKKLPIKLPF